MSLALHKPKTLYSYDAVMMSASEWVECLGVSWQYFYERIQALGSVEEAVAECIRLQDDDEFDEGDDPFADPESSPTPEPF